MQGISKIVCITLLKTTIPRNHKFEPEVCPCYNENLIVTFASLLLLDKEEIPCNPYNMIEPHLFDYLNNRLLLLFDLEILVENNGSSFPKIVPLIKFHHQLFLIHLTFG